MVRIGRPDDKSNQKDEKEKAKRTKTFIVNPNMNSDVISSMKVTLPKPDWENED